MDQLLKCSNKILFFINVKFRFLLLELFEYLKFLICRLFLFFFLILLNHTADISHAESVNSVADQIVHNLSQQMNVFEITL